MATKGKSIISKASFKELVKEVSKYFYTPIILKDGKVLNGKGTGQFANFAWEKKRSRFHLIRIQNEAV